MRKGQPIATNSRYVPVTLVVGLRAALLPDKLVRGLCRNVDVNMYKCL